MLKKNYNLNAFSLVELSIVILIIGILVAAISSGTKIYYNMKLVAARSLTSSSPVSKMKNLELWLETTSLASFSNKIPENNEKISEWYDINPQSSLKIKATTYNDNTRPTYEENTINNLPTIRLDGQNNCMLVDLDIRRRKEPNITIFLVYEKKLPTYNQNAANAILGNDGSWARWILTYRATGPGVSNGSGPITINEIATPDYPMILTHISQIGVANGSSVQLNRNFANIKYTENLSISESNKLAIGSYASNCNVGNSGTTSNANIGEIIIFSRVLNNNEIESIEDYLSQKWRIKLIK